MQTINMRILPHQPRGAVYPFSRNERHFYYFFSLPFNYYIKLMQFTFQFPFGLCHFAIVEIKSLSVCWLENESTDRVYMFLVATPLIIPNPIGYMMHK